MVAVALTARRRIGVVAALIASIAFAACATRRPAPPPTPTTQYGVASWYGPGFDGHPTSSGEIYNQDDLTAASTLYPLGSHVMVTDLDTGKSVEVRINDHGPYVKGRKIDLSRKAARLIGMMNPGTANVRLDLLTVPSGASPLGTPPQYFVQVGSFASSSNADRLRSQLAAYYSDVRVDQIEAGSRRFYRVRMGGFATRGEAEARADQSSRFGLPIVIVSE